jgi:hypothetical protein
MMRSRGMDVFGSPRPAEHQLPIGEQRWLWFRQAAGLALWMLGLGW